MDSEACLRLIHVCQSKQPVTVMRNSTINRTGMMTPQPTTAPSLDSSALVEDSSVLFSEVHLSMFGSKPKSSAKVIFSSEKGTKFYVVTQYNMLCHVIKVFIKFSYQSFRYLKDIIWWN